MRCRILFAGMLLAGSAHAFTGNDLYAMMSNPDRTSQTVSFAYVRGFIDASSFSQSTYRYVDGKVSNGRFFCMPQGATLDQAFELIRNELARQPGQRHLDAHFFAFAALANAWPCPAN